MKDDNKNNEINTSIQANEAPASSILKRSAANAGLYLLNTNKKAFIENDELYKKIYLKLRSLLTDNKKAENLMGNFRTEVQRLTNKTAFFEHLSTQEESEKTKPAYMIILGLCYEFGIGTETNDKKAAELYHTGAIIGSPAAMLMYSLCLKNGRGVKWNNKDAKRWESVAKSLKFPSLGVFLYGTSIAKPISTNFTFNKNSSSSTALALTSTSEPPIISNSIKPAINSKNLTFNETWASISKFAQQVASNSNSKE